jgi:hypothetical protein
MTGGNIMQRILLQLWRGSIYAAAIIFLTWLFFGPIAGFHHMIRCGLLCPLFLNGESPEGGHPMWGEFEVRFSIIRFVISLALWAVCIVFSLRFLGKQTMSKTSSTVEASKPSLRFRIGVISGLVVVAFGLVSSIAPIVAFFDVGFMITISVVALISGFCSTASIFSERGFNRTVAALCLGLSLYFLSRYGMFLLMAIP